MKIAETLARNTARQLAALGLFARETQAEAPGQNARARLTRSELQTIFARELGRTPRAAR